MVRTSQAPATKLDIRILKEDIRDEMRAMRDDIIHQFKFIAEQIHTDAIDANKETIDLHRNRIERLETHVGLPHSLSA